MKSVKRWLFANGAGVLVLLAFVAQSLGWITPDQAEQIRKHVPEKVATAEDQILDPATAPELTTDQILELIRVTIAEALKKVTPPEPTPVVPAPDVVPAPIVVPTPPVPAPTPQPEPEESVRIRLCDETGAEITKTELESGQLFRVSAVGVGDSIGWHPVKSGDVRLSASTDGKEFAGYLTAGQWIEFSLTDYGSKTQASLRVTCLTAPQPPPGPGPAPSPSPGPSDTEPTGALGLIRASRYGMSLVPASARGKAAVIAQAHLAAVEQAKKDPFVLIAAMQKTIEEEIGKGLTDAERLAWKPWSDEVTRVVDRLQNEQKLIGTDGWELAFQEIAEGLGGGR